MSQDDRDVFGNRNTYHDPAKVIEAGGTQWDSAAEIDLKVMHKNNMDAIRAGGYVGSPRAFGKAVALCCCGVLLLLAAAFTQPWWKQLKDPAAMWERFVVARKVDARRAQFSDFSSVGDWPRDVQAMVAREKALTLPELVARIPAAGTLPKKRQDELGAALWFRFSAHGSRTHAVYKETLDKTMKTKDGIWKISELSALPYRFLEGRCAKGVEPACLDLAKAVASVSFHTLYERATEQRMTQAALKRLPQQGPLAASPAIKALRTRLEAYD